MLSTDTTGLTSAADGLLDLALLAKQVSAAEPAGPSLDEEVFALAQRAAPQTGLVEGSTDERNWTTILADATELLTRTRHLKVGVLQAQALVHLHGWAGLRAGTAAIGILLERHWPQLHPPLDEAGDPYRRVNELAALASEEMIVDLRKAPLIGRLSLRDLVDGKTKDADLRAAFLGTPPAARQAASAVLQGLKDIARQMAEHKATLSDLAPLLSLAEEADTRMRNLTLRFGEKNPTGMVSDDTAPQGPLAPSSVGTRAEIRGPEDVVAQLERICDYYERHERSSPVPLLLMRAKQLVNRSFLEAVQDLADKGVPQVQLIIGAEPGKKPG